MSDKINKRYYLWGGFSDSNLLNLNKLQAKVNNQFYGPKFNVHLTLSGPFFNLDNKIIDLIENIALTNNIVEMRTTGYGMEENIFQSFYVGIENSIKLLELKTSLDNHLDISSKEYNPHISLFYGEKEATSKKELMEELSLPPVNIILDKISIVAIYDQIESWEILYSYPLIKNKNVKLSLGRPI
jgi:2'-5' RNA ligase